ncbi:MAG: aldehyde dehydrogenase family protein [Nocardioides sp.]|nr:aldehyde dehydrogenase family protein [Nocardioides sp.]
MRRHATRVRSEVRRLSRTGAIAWDEELLVGPVRGAPTWSPPRTPAEVPEVSPYELVGRAVKAASPWRSLSPLTRACVASEVLHRLVAIRASTAPLLGTWSGLDPQAAARFEGVEARHRAALAIYLALRAQHLRTRRRRLGARPLALDGAGLTQTTELMPRGVSLIFLSEESPCWAPYPAAFANLVTGNTLLVSPSPLGAASAVVLVETWRAVLTDHGLPADTVQIALAPEDDLYFMRELVSHHLIALIDDAVPGAGSAPTLQTNAPHAVVVQEPKGRHVMLLDERQDHANLLAGLAATAKAGAALRVKPLLVVVPSDGIETDAGPRGADQVVDDVRRAVAGADHDRPERAWAFTVAHAGAPQLERLDELRRGPGVRALHLVTSDAGLSRRVAAWAHDAGVFLLVEDSHGGPIGDVRAQEAAATLDDDFVAPRLRTHRARFRT